MYLAHDSGQQTFLAIASEMLNGSCRGFSNSYDCLAVQRSLAERLLRGVVQSWSSKGEIRNLPLVSFIDFGCSKSFFEELANFILSNGSIQMPHFVIWFSSVIDGEIKREKWL